VEDGRGRGEARPERGARGGLVQQRVVQRWDQTVDRVRGGMGGRGKKLGDNRRR